MRRILGMNKLTELNAEIIALSASQKLLESDTLCSTSLQLVGKHDIVETHKKKRASQESIAVIAGLSQNQSCNFSIRFDLELPSLISHKSQWFSGGLFSSASNAVSDIHNYEEVVYPEILCAPICDICIVQKSDPVPEGFYRLSKTLHNKKANLNYKSGGNEIFLCIKKDLQRSAAAITALIVIYPDRNEILPPGFMVVRRGTQVCNINSGTSSERIFICYRKDYIANPIVDILLIMPSKHDETPQNFNTIEFSPSGISANLNSGTGGVKILLAYKLTTTQFSCLENDFSTPSLSVEEINSTLNVSIGKRTAAISLEIVDGCIDQSLQENTNSQEPALYSQVANLASPEELISALSRKNTPAATPSISHVYFSRPKSQFAPYGVLADPDITITDHVKLILAQSKVVYNTLKKPDLGKQLCFLVGSVESPIMEFDMDVAKKKLMSDILNNADVPKPVMFHVVEKALYDIVDDDDVVAI